jgi:anthranilate phosphoribosyltransferase
MKEILQYLFNHYTLSKSEAKAMMIEIAQNKFNATEVTAFISVFLMRNITLKSWKALGKHYYKWRFL